MKNRFHIALHSDRVHEDERKSGLVERRLIATRRLPFAVRQIQQTELLHLSKPAAQRGIELVENSLRPVQELPDVGKRLKRRALKRGDFQNPWAEGREV